MSNAAHSVETSGRTVDDAISEGLRILGATRDEVDITILEGGSKGFLGLGSREASVRVSRKQRSAAGAQHEEPAPERAASGGSRRGRTTARSSDDGEDSRGRRGRADTSDGGESSGRGGSRRGSRGGRGRQTRGSEQRVAADMLPPTLREEHFLPRSRQEQQEQSEQRAAEPRSSRRQRRTEPAATREPRQQGNEPRLIDEPEPPRRQPRDRPVVEPDIDAEAVNLACQTLDDILRILEVEADILIREPETPGEGLGSALAVVDLEGPNMGIIIGRGGETLTSLQYLVNVIVSRRHPGNAAPIFLDAAGYRKRREMEIVELAERMGDRVKRTGRPITLEPMSAAERRIVHLTLADDPELTTSSTGVGESRKVQIHPAN